MEEKTKTKSLREDLKSPWLIGIIATVLTGLLVNVSVIAVSYAYPHSLVAKDYYEKGKAYFHEQAGKEKAKSLGYDLRLNAPEKMILGENVEFRLSITGVKKKPAAQKVILYAYRVDDQSADFQQTLSPRPDGSYVSNVRFLLPGAWDLIVQAEISGEKLDVAKRIFVAK